MSCSHPPAVLSIDGCPANELPVLTDAFGNKFVDIRMLYAEYKVCTFDPGFMSTASCTSKITYIDGDAGILLYRGYPIEQLVESACFYDVAFLLLHGELPNAIEKESFRREITNHTMVHEKIATMLSSFNHDSDPMNVLCGAVGALAAFYPESANVKDPAMQILACQRLIAKMPTIAAMIHKILLKGQPVVYPKNNLSFAENFLYMLHSMPTEPYEVDPVKSKALETILILHMDHEQNASTSTVRTAGSSQADPFSAVSAGIGSLNGPAHGGANVAVMKMLLEIQKLGGVDAIPVILERAKDKSDPFRLMGFGHRVYKNYDPRALIMRKVTGEVLARLDYEDPLLEIAMELEKAAREDAYFVSRSLYPNVDFYSGIVLCALGIPLEMYTVIFTIARVVGWCAQWREYVGEAGAKITRPRQLYQGSVRREFVGMEARTSASVDYEEMTSRRTVERVVTEERVFASMRSLLRSRSVTDDESSHFR